MAKGFMRLLRFTVRVVRSFLRNRGVLLAGGAGYNALLSIVPFLTLVLAMLSLFFDDALIMGVLSRELGALLPRQADMLLEAARTFLQNQAATRVVSFVGLMFFSSIAIRMLEEAMSAIFETSAPEARRKMWVSVLLPYPFMAVLIFALFALTLFTAALDALGTRTIWIAGTELSLAPGVNLLLRAAGFFGLIVLFTLIYRVLPPMKVPIRRAFLGGLCAAVLWQGVGAFLVYYLANVSMVNVIYGSLATVIVLLLFLEIAFVILLLGAQVIAELESSAAAGVPWYEQPKRS